jgi:hypothetical protein
MTSRERKDLPWVIAGFVAVVLIAIVAGFLWWP